MFGEKEFHEYTPERELCWRGKEDANTIVLLLSPAFGMPMAPSLSASRDAVMKVWQKQPIFKGGYSGSNRRAIIAAIWRV
jgi:hypothetical protein